MNFYVFSRIFMYFHVFSCIFSDFHGFPCIFMDFHDFSWISMDFPCIFMDLDGFWACVNPSSSTCLPDEVFGGVKNLNSLITSRARELRSRECHLPLLCWGRPTRWCYGFGRPSTLSVLELSFCVRPKWRDKEIELEILP